MAAVGKRASRRSRKSVKTQPGALPNDVQAVNIDGERMEEQPPHWVDLPNVQRIVTENVLPTPVERIITRRERKQQLRLIREQEDQLPEFEITSTQLSFLGPEEIEAMAIVTINNEADDGLNTINDPRLGSIETNQLCETCFKSSQECPGHSGAIKLNMKIYNPLTLKYVALVLQAICNDCSGLLITKDEFEGYNSLSGEARLKKIVEMSKKRVCTQPPVPGAKICRMNPDFKTANIKKYGRIDAKTKNKTVEVPIEDIYNILDSIDDETAQFLGFTPPSHPRNFILESILILPPCARPPSVRDGIQFPNPINALYKNIIKNNKAYALSSTKQKKDKHAADIVRLFTQIIAGSDTPDITGDFKGIQNIIKGKEGLIRGSIMGKRVNYAARTVVGPGPDLRYGQVGVPREFASIITVPEVVMSTNIDHLQYLVDNKKASSVTFKDGTQKVDDRHIVLSPGDVVHRHLQDGDYTIFNRQPTLHKQGMMGGEIVLHDDRIIKIHLSYTSSFNADFDGDEMNLHIPQTLEAYREVRHLLNVNNCILDPQTNKPAAAAVFDALTGVYLMTLDRTTVSDRLMQSVLFKLTERSHLESLHARLRKYKLDPGSGKAMFSALLPEDFFYSEGKVSIKEGILVSGNVSKKHVGISPKSMIIDLHKIYGRNRATSFLTDISFATNLFLAQTGFTIGLADCYPESPKLQQIIAKEIGISKHFAKSMKLNIEDGLENRRKEQQLVGKLRSIVGRIAAKVREEKIQPVEPAMSIMAASGAKGNQFNVNQMTTMLGQQFLWGERMQMIMSNGARCLPYFKEGELDPEARGFCLNSFSTGLTPAEFWYHLGATREGLIDTAIKTSDTGYTHRKINKLLEDLMIEKHGMVVNAGKNIIQFIYGEDGLRPDRLQLRPFGEDAEIATFANLDILAAQVNAEFGYV